MWIVTGYFACEMSGHSKWAQIKRKKGATDVKRGKLFSKLAKQITVAARLGKNLDMAVSTARAANMPKDNIDRAIAKGTGAAADGVQIEEAVYEAFGPGGTAIVITALTDNKNRTIGELRTLANKLGFTLGNAGSVRHLFDHRGILVSEGHEDVESAQLTLIDAGAADVQVEEDAVIAYTEIAELDQVRTTAEAAGIFFQAARLGFVPKMPAAITDDERQALLKILEAIDELDDVDSVETNATL